MSFDLYVFDLDDLPDSEEAIGELLEDQAGWDVPLTERLTAFVDELEQRHPDLEDDPDGPWASSPSAQSVVSGHGCAFNIQWSAVDRVAADIAALCRARGLTLYDPQSSTVTRPTSPGDPPAHPAPRSGKEALWRRASRSRPWKKTGSASPKANS